ncbi:hypothetical protein M5E84_10270 [[Ruminococcus] torques]|nr:hypothetical protein M5E84_10270 [[Ruminococcus] torques]
MQDIAKAMSWGEIRAAVELFFRTLNFQAEEENENADLSPLIQKALQMVKRNTIRGLPWKKWQINYLYQKNI